MCDHRLFDDPTGLICNFPGVYPSGHTYETPDGSSVPDRHDRPGSGDGE